MQTYGEKNEIVEKDIEIKKKIYRDSEKVYSKKIDNRKKQRQCKNIQIVENNIEIVEKKDTVKKRGKNIDSGENVDCGKIYIDSGNNRSWKNIYRESEKNQ